MQNGVKYSEHWLEGNLLNVKYVLASLDCSCFSEVDVFVVASFLLDRDEVSVKQKEKDLEELFVDLDYYLDKLFL